MRLIRPKLNPHNRERRTVRRERGAAPPAEPELRVASRANASSLWVCPGSSHAAWSGIRIQQSEYAERHSRVIRGLCQRIHFITQRRGRVMPLSTCPTTVTACHGRLIPVWGGLTGNPTRPMSSLTSVRTIAARQRSGAVSSPNKRTVHSSTSSMPKLKKIESDTAQHSPRCVTRRSSEFSMACPM